MPRYNPLIFSGLDLVGGGSTIGIGTPIAGSTPYSILSVDGSSTLSERGPLTNGQILIGSTGNAAVAASLTGTVNQLTVTPGAGSITLSLPQNIHTAATPQFSSITLSSASNQINLSSGANLLTINSGTSAAARQYLVPDVGVAADFVMTEGNQTIDGDKNFLNEVIAPGIDVATIGGTLGLGFVNAGTINIGNSGSTVNIIGTTNFVNVTNYEVADKNITVNKNGPAASGSGAGLEIEENALITGYAVINGARTAWSLKAPATAGIVDIVPGASGFTLDQGSHNPLSLSTPGLGISLNAGTQTLSAQYASTTQPGLLSSTDFTTFNNKANSDLGNLTSTAINQSLVPATDIAIDLGTGTNRYNNLYTRFLLDDADVSALAVDSATRLLQDTAGNDSINFDNRVLFDNGGTASANYDTRLLINTVGTTVLDFSGTNLDVNTRKIVNVQDPTSAQDAATRNYVDNADANKANVSLNNVTGFTAGSVLFAGTGTVNQDNANLFFDDTNNRLGIGTSAPAVDLHVKGTSTAMRVERVDASATGPIFQGRKARGTIGAESAVLSGDAIATFNALGYGATAYASSATGFVSMTATENHTDSAKGTRVNIGTTPAGSTTAVTSAVISDATFAIGRGLTNATAVNSTVRGTDITSGTADTASGTLGIRSGLSTGNQAGGSIFFQVSPAGTSGSTQNTALTRFTINADGLIGIRSPDSTKTIGLYASNSATTHNYVFPLTQGTSGQVLRNDGSGNLSWGTVISNNDILPTSFSAANNQATPSNVTGLSFNPAQVRSFEAIVSVAIDATADLFEQFKLNGIYNGTSWYFNSTSVGDTSNVVFSITNAGQVQYTSGNEAGFVSSTFIFRALTT